MDLQGIIEAVFQIAAEIQAYEKQCGLFSERIARAAAAAEKRKNIYFVSLV